MEKTCPQCNSPLKLKQGTSKTTGKPYSFWGCTGYPNCKYTERDTNPPKPQAPVNDEKVLDGLRNLYSVLLDIKAVLTEIKDKQL